MRACVHVRIYVHLWTYVYVIVFASVYAYEWVCKPTRAFFQK